MTDTFDNDILLTADGQIDHNAVEREAVRRADSLYGKGVDEADYRMWRDRMRCKAEMLRFRFLRRYHHLGLHPAIVEADAIGRQDRTPDQRQIDFLMAVSNADKRYNENVRQATSAFVEPMAKISHNVELDQALRDYRGWKS
jgi:hypothetical protein